MDTVTVKEAAEYLSTTIQQIRRMIKRGQLQAYNIGTENRALWRIPIENLRDLLTKKKGE